MSDTILFSRPFTLIASSFSLRFISMMILSYLCYSLWYFSICSYASSKSGYCRSRALSCRLNEVEYCLIIFVWSLKTRCCSSMICSSLLISLSLSTISSSLSRAIWIAKGSWLVSCEDAGYQLPDSTLDSFSWSMSRARGTLVRSAYAFSTWIFSFEGYLTSFWVASSSCILDFSDLKKPSMLRLGLKKSRYTSLLFALNILISERMATGSSSPYAVSD